MEVVVEWVKEEQEQEQVPVQAQVRVQVPAGPPAKWKVPVCQCCLSGSPETAFFDLASHAGGEADASASLFDLLAACFAIRLLPNEYDIEQYIACEPCVLRLRDTFSFRCQIEDSQAKLRQAFGRLEEDARFAAAAESPSLSADEPRVECELEQDPEPDAEVLKKPKPKTKRKKKKRDRDGAATGGEAYEAAVRNLMSDDKKKRNNVKAMSSVEFRRYRRLYYRLRYAKMIPFKLDEESLACDACGATFATRKLLASHMGAHYPNHICALCGKAFVVKEQLSGHMRAHSDERLECAVCGKRLKKTSMTRHLRTHTADRNEPYACPECPRRFVSFAKRLRHMAHAHAVDIFKHRCTMCAKKFHLSTSLSKHVRRCHFQELNVECRECGKRFFDNKALRNHALRHTDEKRYRCEACGKSYARKSTIVEHMKIHNDDRRHKCDVCDRSFVQKCTLKNHLKIHAQQRAPPPPPPPIPQPDQIAAELFKL